MHAVSPSRGCVIGLLLGAAGCGRIGFDLASGDAPAGGNDGPASGIDQGCADATILCDGFESSTATTFPMWDRIDLINWQDGGQAAQGTACEVATTPTWIGLHALEAIGNGSEQQAFLEKALPTPRPAVVYARAFVRLPSSDNPGTFDLFGYVGSASFVFLELQPFDGRLQFNGSLGIPGQSMPALTLRDHWYCVELMTRFAASGGEVQVNVDGVSVFDDPNAMTDPVADPAQNFYAGVSTGAPETTTVHVFYDDVALSANPIGCQ